MLDQQTIARGDAGRAMSAFVALRFWFSRISVEKWLGFALTLALVALIVVPLAELIRETFTVQQYDRVYLPGAKVGDFTFFHYERVFNSKLSMALFFKPFLNSLITAFAATVVCLALGGTLAWLVVRTDIPFRGTLHTIVMIPYMLPSWVMALGWLIFFKNERIGGSPGVFAYLTGMQPPDWLAYGAVPIVICLSLHYYVYAYLTVSTSIANVDSQLEEAGAMAGLSRRKQLLMITMPLLLPAIGSAVVMTFIRVVGSFGTPAVLGMPVRFYVLPTQIYAAIGMRNIGDGFLLALVLVLLAGLFIYINQRLIGVRKSFVTLTGKGFRTRTTPLGWWRWPALLLIGFLLLAAVVFPLGLLVLQSLIKQVGNYDLANLTLYYWIGGNSEGMAINQPSLVDNADIIASTWNSLKLSFFAALGAGFFGALISYVVVRTRGSFGSRALETIAFMPYIFPALAFGAIYIGLFARPIGPIPALYGTFALLVLICTVKMLPIITRTSISTLLQLDKSLDEAAVTLRASTFRALRTVVLPLLKPAIVTALVYSFVRAMTTVSAVIFLVSAQYEMATVFIINRVINGDYGLAIAYCAVLIVLMMGAIGLINLLVGSRRLGRRQAARPAIPVGGRT